MISFSHLSLSDWTQIHTDDYPDVIDSNGEGPVDTGSLIGEIVKMDWNKNPTWEFPMFDVIILISVICSLYLDILNWIGGCHRIELDSHVPLINNQCQPPKKMTCWMKISHLNGWKNELLKVMQQSNETIWCQWKSTDFPLSNWFKKGIGIWKDERYFQSLNLFWFPFSKSWGRPPTSPQAFFFSLLYSILLWIVMNFNVFCDSRRELPLKCDERYFQ